MDIVFNKSSGDSVFEGIYSYLFHDPESSEPIIVKLTGNGFENRELLIEKHSEVIVPAVNRHQRRADAKVARSQGLNLGQTISVPILVSWTDENGVNRKTRVSIGPQGLTFEGTMEKLPNAFFFAAQVPVPSEEAAGHFSKLDKKRDTEKFLAAFQTVFNEITRLSVSSDNNSSVLMADVPWATRLLPLPALSGGTNRTAAILLSIAIRQNGCVLVDEVESGLYHGRHQSFAKALMDLSKAYETQLIMTSHSQEWIDSILEVSDESDDIAFWRMERGADQQVQLRRFTFSQYKAGSAAGEMR